MRSPSLATRRDWKVALVDPGDFTPAYDSALAMGLIQAGCDLRQFGRYGFSEADRLDCRHDHFYRGLESKILGRAPGAIRRAMKGALHGFDLARLGRLLAQWQPGIIHVQWLPLPILDGLFLPRLQSTAPLVFTLHDSNPYNGAVGRAMRLGYFAVIDKADAVIVHTAQAEARLAALNVASGRIHRVPIGLLHHDSGQTQVERARCSAAPLRLLQFGKIKPYKGIDVLLAALALLDPAERSRVQLRIVGQPYMDVESLRQFVAANALTGIVEFQLGFAPGPQIADLFAWADAAVLPYREIDASAVAMTAVAHGVPVLASAIGGFREQFSDGREARLVPPGDPAALAGVIRGWIAEPHQLDRLRSGMRAERSLVPSWIDIAQKTMQVYAHAHTVWTKRRARIVGRSTKPLSRGITS